jgi:diguanylate cyclase (GGDEF)-like protein
VRNQDSLFGPISHAPKSGYPAAVARGATESQELDGEAEIERLRDKIARLEERVRQLDELAHQDPLVCVLNRRGFMRELQSVIARVSRYGESAAMLFVDIDGLKRINDGFGHKAGDEALIQVARALADGVRKSDLVARLGGDEFGILLIHSDEAAARDTAARLTSAIEAEEINCAGNRVSLGVAIGAAVIGSEDDPDSVIARADRAMYERKDAA